MKSQIPVCAVIIGHTVIIRDAAGTCHRADTAQIHRLIHRKDTDSLQTCLDGVVIEKDRRHLFDLLAQADEPLLDALLHGIREVTAHAAHLADGEDDAAAGRFFENIQDRLAKPPAVHEKALEAQRIRAKPEPQEMAVQAGKLMPDRTQVARTARHVDLHQPFDGLRIAPAMPEGADAADTLCDIDELLEIALLDQLFQSAVDVADGRHGADDFLILQLQIQMDRLRQDRMLRAKGNGSEFSHCHPPSSRQMHRHQDRCEGSPSRPASRGRHSTGHATASSARGGRNARHSPHRAR